MEVVGFGKKSEVGQVEKEKVKDENESDGNGVVEVMSSENLNKEVV